MQTICQGCIYLPPGQGVTTEEGQHSGWGPGLCSALHSAHSAQHGQSWHWPWHRGQGEIVIIFILALHHCDLWYISAHFGSSLLIHHIYILSIYSLKEYWWSRSKNKKKYNSQSSSRHLDYLYLVPPGALVVAAQPLEVLVHEVSGGPEGDQEPAQHHGDRPSQVHRLMKENYLLKL